MNSTFRSGFVTGASRQSRRRCIAYDPSHLQPTPLRLFLFDLPRGVMRNVHREIATGAGQRRHVYTSKWLSSADSFVLARAARNDMSATIHLRLGLVEVASIESREDLVAIAIGQHAGTVDVFLVS